MTVDMSGFMQFAGAYNVLTQNQNGVEAGILTGVDIERDGTIIASFSNGEQIPIYQIPLARFVNPNALEARSGTLFSQTEEAGDLVLAQAGGSEAGIIIASALEGSNVELADEFAKLIVSQRAFQANSRVISTVDEMTQQLRSLKS
jgi:flagellar hook protein FlgE